MLFLVFYIFHELLTLKDQFFFFLNASPLRPYTFYFPFVNAVHNLIEKNSCIHIIVHSPIFIGCLLAFLVLKGVIPDGASELLILPQLKVQCHTKMSS